MVEECWRPHHLASAPGFAFLLRPFVNCLVVMVNDAFPAATEKEYQAADTVLSQLQVVLL